jgi:hypothetical protein
VGERVGLHFRVYLSPVIEAQTAFNNANNMSPLEWVNVWSSQHLFVNSECHHLPRTSHNDVARRAQTITTSLSSVRPM